MSALSYLSERPAPMVTVRSGCAGSIWTCLVSSVGLNVGAAWKPPAIPRAAFCAKEMANYIFFVSSAITIDSARAEPAEAHCMDTL